jgi:hypothetical protein
MTRVQIPAYTDRWMMGDRFGEIVKITKRRKLGIRETLLTRANVHRATVEIAHVKLDKSGKTVRVILDDCREV